MSDQLILSLESLSAFTSRTSLYTTVVWPIRRVNIGVGVQEVLYFESDRSYKAASEHLLAIEKVAQCNQDMGTSSSGLHDPYLVCHLCYPPQLDSSPCPFVIAPEHYLNKRWRLY